ncbi:flavodoxin family protein [Bacillus marasmi]|uniref:flavodoxin family protein n=1 Tax=Bacillus marasmi TaxID=1926279 RepID=UPI00164EB0A2|nr:flavodoxin family protein [Bacillus marasmi]
MKKEFLVVIVYDSIFGNTKRIADRIGLELCNDCRIIAGSIHHEIEPDDIPEIDLLIIGSPTHSHKPTHEMSEFLDRLAAKTTHIKHAAVFDTRYNMHIWLSGSAAKKMTKKLQQIGIETLCNPESFLVTKWEGPLKANEILHAEQWARDILHLLENFHGVTHHNLH